MDSQSPLHQQIPASDNTYTNSNDQPSFDQVVELISTGRADQIPGIKQIPLKINESAPSEPSMTRPLKPWEREAAQSTTMTTSESNNNAIDTQSTSTS